MFENLELALAGPKSFWKMLVARLTPPERERIDEVLEVIGLAAQRAVPGGRAVARPEAVAGDRHAAHAGAGAPARRRAGRRHDAAGDRAHGGAAAVAGGQALGRRRRARHGVRAVDREPRHRAARGPRARRRATWTRCRTIRASSRSTSAHEPAGRQGAQSVVRRQPHAVGRRSRRPAGLADVPHGPQRHGQDHAAEVHHGPAAGDVGRDRVCRHRHPRAAGGEPRAPRHRLRAAGARDLPAADGRGEPARRASACARTAREPFRRGSSSCSRC